MNLKSIPISINMAKIANSQSKTGQDATFAPTLNVHQNYQLVETIRMVSISKLYQILLSFQF